MAFTDLEDRGAMLVLLDGTSELSLLKTCSMCKKPLLRVFVTVGVRRRNPKIPQHQDVCITKSWMGPVPCPRAALSLGVIDALMEASRA